MDLIRSRVKTTSTYMGCSHHSVPSLSKVAMRSGAGTKSGLPGRVVSCTSLTIAALTGPSFHDGSGSVTGDVVAQPASSSATIHSDTASRPHQMNPRTCLRIAAPISIVRPIVAARHSAARARHNRSMRCARCGSSLDDDAKVCGQCGAVVGVSYGPPGEQGPVRRQAPVVSRGAGLWGCATFVERVKSILRSPRTEWPAIAERADHAARDLRGIRDAARGDRRAGAGDRGGGDRRARHAPRVREGEPGRRGSRRGCCCSPWRSSRSTCSPGSSTAWRGSSAASPTDCRRSSSSPIATRPSGSPACSTSCPRSGCCGSPPRGYAVYLAVGRTAASHALPAGAHGGVHRGRRSQRIRALDGACGARDRADRHRAEPFD